MNDTLQRLEDKVISLVDELESLRTKLRAMTQENQELQRASQELKELETARQEKLQGLVSLLDSVESEIASAPASTTAESMTTETTHVVREEVTA